MGTRDGGIHALSLEVTPEGSVEKEEETGTADNRPREGEGKFSATSPSGENACSDTHSSSSSEGRSRPSTPPMDDLALDHTGEEWLVRYFLPVVVYGRRKMRHAVPALHSGIRWLRRTSFIPCGVKACLLPKTEGCSGGGAHTRFAFQDAPPITSIEYSPSPVVLLSPLVSEVQPNEDGPADAPREVWERGGKRSTDASEFRWEERRRTASPDTVSKIIFPGTTRMHWVVLQI